MTALETTFGEDKATITGAGNRTSGPVLRSGCPQLVLQEAWAWLTATQLVRAGEAATLRSESRRPRPAPQGRAAGHRRRVLTAAWHHAVRSMETTQVTAASSLAALATAGDAAARAHLHALTSLAGTGTPLASRSTPDSRHAATKPTVTGYRSSCTRPPSLTSTPAPRVEEAGRTASSLGTALPIRRDTAEPAPPYSTTYTHPPN